MGGDIDASIVKGAWRGLVLPSLSLVVRFGLHAAADFPHVGRFRGSKLTQVLRDGLVGSAVRHRFGSKEMINPV